MTSVARPADSLNRPLARRLLHMVHLVTFVVLLATGLLLFVPELRALATGGYSLLIRQVHLWTGVASVLLPLVLLFRFGAASLRPVAVRSKRAMVKSVHFATIVAMTLFFALTGFVIWPSDLPYESIVDASRSAHGWLTYAAAALVTVHLVEVGVTASISRMTAPGERLGEETRP